MVRNKLSSELLLLTPAIDLQREMILPVAIAATSEHMSSEVKPSLNVRNRTFKEIIVKCVLQLLLIETTHNLLRNDVIYTTIPQDQLLRLVDVLANSYEFASKFNSNKKLRVELWKVGA